MVVPLSEIDRLPPETSSRLIYDGMVFGTTFRRKGKAYGGVIVARNWGHAVEVADARGLGETIDGQLEASIRHDGEGPTP